MLQIWEKLRPLDLPQIKKNISAIKKLVRDNTSSAPLPLNADQLRLLSAAKLSTIGLHTDTHPDLERKGKKIQMEEIISCKQNLETNYGIVSNYLAYPYGRYDSNTLEAVSEIGLPACFTTEDVSIDDGALPYKLGRHQVGNWDVDFFKNNLQQWRRIKN